MKCQRMKYSIALTFFCGCSEEHHFTAELTLAEYLSHC